ncbi:MAG: hypothetical protein M0Z80_02155 [Treponema sp.]|nr:hypothetical protein [Treponema sp.]
MKQKRPRAALIVSICALALSGHPLQAAGDLSAGAHRPAAMPVPRDFPGILADIRAFGERVENSAPERRAFDYIEAACKEYGLEVSRLSFDEAPGGYSTSRILEARVGGSRGDELALVVPVDSWIDAAPGEGGAVGVALALAEAEVFGSEAAAGRRPPVTLRFVFLGAERRGPRRTGEEASLGSSTWIARAEGLESLAVIYLSMEGLSSSIGIENAGKGVLSPFWHYDRTRLALEAAGFDLRLEANRMQIFRLGLGDRYGPAAPYLAAGIPALAIRGWGSAPDSDQAKIGGEFTKFMRNLLRRNEAGFNESWDRHYLIIQLGTFSAVVRETSYVAFLVLFSAFAVGAALVLSVTRRARLKAAVHRVPIMGAQLLALFAVLCAILLLERGMSALDGLVIGSSSFWRLSPRLFAGARVVASFFLFLSILSILVERRVLTPNPYFYEFAALVCLACDIYIFSAIRLTLSFYFVWAFFIVALSLAARRPFATLIAFCLMYAPIGLLAVELILRPEYAVYLRLMAPSITDGLVIAATSLPFFTFVASPLLFYSRHGPAARRRAIFVFALIALSIEGGALAYATLGPARSSPGAPGPSAFTLSETIDQDRGRFSAVMSAARRIGKGLLLRGGERLPYRSAEDRVVLGGPDGERIVSVAQSTSAFLDRVDDAVAISWTRAPYSVELRLSGERELQIYDCDLPYQVSLDGKSAVIFAGVNPGKHLRFSLTVPLNFDATLEVHSGYLHPLVPYRFAGGGAPAEGDFSVLYTTRLGGSAGG